MPSLVLKNFKYGACNKEKEELEKWVSVIMRISEVFPLSSAFWRVYSQDFAIFQLMTWNIGFQMCGGTMEHEKGWERIAWV